VLLAVIAGCEIGFWVLLAAGMVTRYLLRRPKAGLVLLAGVPLVDVLLQPAVTWTIVLVVDGLVSFSYSLDGKSEKKQPV
jgi:CTP:molybdopterin cytidylyltransferase MocA